MGAEAIHPVLQLIHISSSSFSSRLHRLPLILIGAEADNGQGNQRTKRPTERTTEPTGGCARDVLCLLRSLTHPLLS